MKLGSVLVVVDYYQAGCFFVNLAKNDIRRKYKVLTTLPSIKLLCRDNGIECRLLSNLNGQYDNEVYKIGPKDRVRETQTGVMSLKNANVYKDILYHEIDTSIIENKHESIICWNGEDVIGYTCRLFRGRVKTRFLEISNIPGKIFADSKGVNASSSLFKNIEKLDALRNDDLVFENWKENYIDYKVKHSIVKQAINGRKIGVHNFYDTLYAQFLGGKWQSFKYLYDKFKIKVKKNSVSELINFERNINGGFIFFPMQVSNDSQIVLNSKIGGNFEVVDLILNRNSKYNLVVKPHPAEQDMAYLERFVNKYKNKVTFSNDNTFELLKKSAKVYTINSTVGLEALILGKSVEFLGESIFSSFNEKRLQAYISNFLINIDFFESSKISQSEIDRVFDDIL
ncbi:hypothetical protein L4C34_05605 [Vibrio profundum]|uniref:capsular polysaccharide export protein, LipB/KpsS family n=1 Tax=Vibrio profundum TaxID=2910247 RepID=UPI003D0C9D66